MEPHSHDGSQPQSREFSLSLQRTRGQDWCGPAHRRGCGTPPVPVSVLAVTSLGARPGHGVRHRGRGLWNAVPEAVWLQGRSRLSRTTSQTWKVISEECWVWGLRDSTGPVYSSLAILSKDKQKANCVIDSRVCSCHTVWGYAGTRKVLSAYEIQLETIG